jgi:hypothetical protein
MSDGGRGRATLGVNGWKSSQMWSAQRSAVRSIAWLDSSLCTSWNDSEKGNAQEADDQEWKTAVNRVTRISGAPLPLFALRAAMDELLCDAMRRNKRARTKQRYCKDYDDNCDADGNQMAKHRGRNRCR